MVDRNHLVTAQVLDLIDRDRDTVVTEIHKLRPHPDLQFALETVVDRVIGIELMIMEYRFAVIERAGQHVHTRRTDKVTGDA